MFRKQSVPHFEVLVKGATLVLVNLVSLRITKKSSVLISSCVVLVATYWVFVVGRGLAPGVIPDELIYSVQARYLSISEAEYGNYLYLAIYQVTSLFGLGFYDAAKFLNAVFWILQSVAVFLLSRLFLTPRGSLGLMVIWGFSPVITYNFLFMPEAMYGAMFAWVIYCGVRAFLDTNKGHSHTFLIVSILLAALAANVKPHAIFLLPALVIFWQGGGLASMGRASIAIRALSSFSLFWSLKLALGFILAGSSGVNVLPVGYAPWSDGANRTPKPYSSSYLGDGTLLFDPGTPTEVLFNQTALFSLLTFVTLGPILLVSISVWRAASGRLLNADSDETVQGRILLRLLLLLGNGVAIGFAFGYYYSVSVGDHSDRVVLRHMEPFIFVVFLAAIWVLTRGLRPSKPTFAIGLILAACASALIIFDIGPGFRYTKTDSMMIASIGETSIWILQFFLATLFSIGIASSRLLGSAKAALYVSLAFIPVAGLYSVTSYVEDNQLGKTRASPDAIAFINSNLTESQRVTIVAPDAAEVGSTAFLLTDVNFELKLASLGRSLGTLDLVDTTSHFLVSSRVLLDPRITGFSILSSSEEYILLKPDNQATSLTPAGALLGSEGITLSSAYGLSGSSVVSVVKRTELIIAQVAPSASSLIIKMSLDPSIANRTATIFYLGQSAQLEMSVDGSASEITLDLDPTSSKASVYIETSLLNVVDLAEDQIRNVGLRLESVELVSSLAKD